MAQAESRYDGLTALFINCTLKKSPNPSHTETLMQVPMGIMKDAGVSVDLIRAVDHDIAPGVYHDMTEHGVETDEWPVVYDRVRKTDILVIGSPIWLGEQSSVCTRVIERLYAESGNTNDQGQYEFFGQVGGCVVTGNEDGVKHVARSVLYALQHIGFVIPPQAETGWIGEAGPGKSYGDEHEDGSRAGFDNTFTQRTATFMAWNLMHLAGMIKDAGGIPSYGNNVEEWKNGERFGYRDPA